MERIPVRSDGLQLEEDRCFQERYWSAERAAWLAFGLIVFGALAGLSGSGGIVSRQTLLLPDAEITAPRIARWEADERLVVTFAPGERRTRSIYLDRHFFDDFQIEAVTPDPVRSLGVSKGIRLEFETDDGSLHVSFQLRPERSARAVYKVGIDDTAEANLTTWVLP